MQHCVSTCLYSFVTNVRQRNGIDVSRELKNLSIWQSPWSQGSRLSIKWRSCSQCQDQPVRTKVGCVSWSSCWWKAGYIQLAQIVRYRAFWNHDGDRGKCLQWSARWIIQRDIYVEDKVGALQKSMAISSDNQMATELSHRLNTYQAEL